MDRAPPGAATGSECLHIEEIVSGLVLQKPRRTDKNGHGEMLFAQLVHSCSRTVPARNVEMKLRFFFIALFYTVAATPARSNLLPLATKRTRKKSGKNKIEPVKTR